MSFDYLRRFVVRLHANERGSMSIVTIFAMLLLAALLGMMMNVGRHLDRKVKMQNAVDSATYSGGVVLARSMNTLAFSNHLLCDVFALTALLREGRDGNAQQKTGPILDSWTENAPKFGATNIPRLNGLEQAIPQKVALERELVRTFSAQERALSEQLLPVMEMILNEELIPEFQRALVETTPRLAQATTDTIAQRHGPVGSGLSGPEPMRGVLWRTDANPVGGPAEAGRSTLPVVDPARDQSSERERYLEIATKQRRDVSFAYLVQLNNPVLSDFDRVGKMSQFANLWRGFTRGQLKKLLEQDYPDTNLPFVLRHDPAERTDPNRHLEQTYMFVGVAYWTQMPERLPGLFQNPLDADDATFAQVYLFIPRARLVKWPGAAHNGRVFRESVPMHWDLMNQNWTVQLVPATSSSVPAILQTTPPGVTARVANLGGVSVESFRRLNSH